MFEIFQEVDALLMRFDETHGKRGRPPKFTNGQIIKCMMYQVFYRIRSYRELQWRLQRDHWAKRAIGLTEIPDHSTFCRRSKVLEESVCYELFQELLSELQPSTHVCYIDSTALRASRYDRDAEKGKGTRLGWFYGYKLHAIVSEDLIPLVWDISPANFYDNQFGYLMKSLASHDVFFLLGDAAYDDQSLFSLAKPLGFHLVTQVNQRRAKSPEVLRDQNRKKNWLFVKHGLGKKLLSKRTGIERFFSILKVNYGLEQPRLFGIQRYYRHALWIILVYLFDCLQNMRKNCDTKKAPWNR
jgi:hypothetical protein